MTDKGIQHVMSWIALAMAFYSCVVLCLCHLRNDHMRILTDHPSGLLTVAEVSDMLDTVPVIIVVNWYGGHSVWRTRCAACYLQCKVPGGILFA